MKNRSATKTASRYGLPKANKSMSIYLSVATWLPGLFLVIVVALIGGSGGGNGHLALGDSSVDQPFEYFIRTTQDSPMFREQLQQSELPALDTDPLYMLGTQDVAPGIMTTRQFPSFVGSIPQLDPVQLEPVDVRQLAEVIRQLKQHDSSDDGGGPMISDVNSHLPANGPLGDSMDSIISGPVNDPAEFEAAMSYLTNTLNHEIPNSDNRSAVLDELVSVYLGNMLKGLGEAGRQRFEGAGQQQQQPLDQQLNPVNEPLTTTEAESLARSSTFESHNVGGGGEYIDHPLALIGHQYMQGGAGEGRQLLGPDGTFENVQVIKSDHAVPSYCDPPNPCPIGYTAEQGCLERFVNSASFSREYQAKQQCSCDNEHSLFNCASPVSTIKSATVGSSYDDPNGVTGSSSSSPQSSDGVDNSIGYDDSHNQKMAGSKLDTLARTIQNRFGGLAGVRSLLAKHEQETMTAGTADNDGAMHKRTDDLPKTEQLSYSY